MLLIFYLGAMWRIMRLLKLWISFFYALTKFLMLELVARNTGMSGQQIFTIILEHLFPSRMVNRIVLETDANSIVTKVASYNIDSGAPLSEQVRNFLVHELYILLVESK
ncbi:hypothetical protein ACS0TY_036027 [Phlomoides rotata]